MTRGREEPKAPTPSQLVASGSKTDRLMRPQIEPNLLSRIAISSDVPFAFGQRDEGGSGSSKTVADPLERMGCPVRNRATESFLFR